MFYPERRGSLRDAHTGRVRYVGTKGSLAPPPQKKEKSQTSPVARGSQAIIPCFWTRPKYEARDYGPGRPKSSEARPIETRFATLISNAAFYSVLSLSAR